MSVLKAPASWQCIEFISDLHLHEGLPRTFEAFASYLSTTQADAIFILGDLFEAWVGDDMRQQPFEASCTRVLAQAGQHRYLGIMVGNRDFLLHADMMQACHAHALPDPMVLEAFGQRHLLTHGDAWCLNDAPYQAFRSKIRHPDWIAQFLSQPLDARLGVARQMRTDSKAEHRGMAYLADVDKATAQQAMQQWGCSTLIHGHTHRPGSELFTDSGGWRHVLSDWNLDDPDTQTDRAQVLRLSPEGFHRVDLTRHQAS